MEERRMKNRSSFHQDVGDDDDGGGDDSHSYDGGDGHDGKILLMFNHNID